MSADKMNFEKKLSRLEEIVSKMEKGDLTLEDSLKLFEEGVQLSRDCNSKLNEAEAKIKKLVSVDENGLPITEDFTSQD